MDMRYFIYYITFARNGHSSLFNVCCCISLYLLLSGPRIIAFLALFMKQLLLVFQRETSGFVMDNVDATVFFIGIQQQSWQSPC